MRRTRRLAVAVFVGALSLAGIGAASANPAQCAGGALSGGNPGAVGQCLQQPPQ